MPILKSDLPSMQPGIDQVAGAQDKLRSLILGHQQALESQQHQADVDVGKAQQMIPVDVSKANAMLQPEGAKQMQAGNNNIALARKAQQGQPQGTDVKISDTGAGISPPDPLTRLLKGGQLQDREDAMQGREVGNLQQDFSKLTSYKPTDVAALNNIQQTLKANNSMSYGQLQNELGKLAGSGVRVTEQDVARVLPATAKRQAKGLARYLGVGGGVADDMLSPEEMKGVQGLLDSKRDEVQKSLDNAGEQMKAVGAARAPTLAKRGQLNSTLGTLGMSAKANLAQPGAAPAAPTAASTASGTAPLSPAEQAELAALKAKHGQR